jgi:hypothetical protein
MAGTGAGTSIITTFMPLIHKGHHNSLGQDDSNEADDLPMYFEVAPSWKGILDSYSSLSIDKKEELTKLEKENDSEL